jgi:hypothetical protein
MTDYSAWRTGLQAYAPLVGHCKQDDTPLVYVGRGPDGRDFRETPIGERGWLGNPYALSEGYSRVESVQRFETAFVDRLRDDPQFAGAVAGLAGKRLGCWCQQLHEENGDLCHGLVIAKWATKLASIADESSSDRQ